MPDLPCIRAQDVLLHPSQQDQLYSATQVRCTVYFFQCCSLQVEEEGSAPSSVKGSKELPVKWDSLLNPHHCMTDISGDSFPRLTTSRLAHPYFLQLFLQWGCLYCAAQEGAGSALLSAEAGEGQGQLSCSYDLRANSATCLRYGWRASLSRPCFQMADEEQDQISHTHVLRYGPHVLLSTGSAPQCY